jgi:molecular chaperone GrpE (heat shock protein)
MADRNVEQKLEELTELFKERLRTDSVQQKAFDQLYEELKQYKEDFLFQAEKPFLLDLLLFYDSLNWFHQSLEKGEMSQEVVADSFQYLLDEFLELLYRRDVIPCERTDKFDRRLHKAVRVVPTGNAGEDWKVQQVLKRGFMRADRLLRAEEVAVFRVGADSGDENRD